MLTCYSLLPAASAINSPQGVPPILVRNTPSSMTVTVSIQDPALITSSINLVRLDDRGTSVATLGTLHDDGHNGDLVSLDNTYALQLTAAEPASGHLVLAVSAAFRGQLRRVMSPSVTVPVVETLAQIPPTGGSLQVSNPNSSINGVTVIFPPGSVSRSTTVGILPAATPTTFLTLMDTQGGGPAIELVPSGMTFDQPLTIKFPYNITSLQSANPQTLGMATVEGISDFPSV